MTELDASLAKALVLGVALRHPQGVFTDFDVGSEIMRACGLTIVPSAINRILGAVPVPGHPLPPHSRDDPALNPAGSCSFAID